MSKPKNLFKFYIPSTLSKYYDRSISLYGNWNIKKIKDQIVYEYFINDHITKNGLVSLKKISINFHIKFVNNYLDEKFEIIFDSISKLTQIKIFKNGKEINTNTDDKYLIFIYDSVPNFYSKTPNVSTQSIYANQLKK